MKQFQYKAVTPDGKKLQGMVEARDQDHATKVLRERRLLITEIKDPQKTFDYQIKIRLLRVNEGDIADFTRQFATMINAGLPMPTALQLLRERAKPAMVTLLDEIISNIEGGESLYKALAKHPDTFFPLYLALVKAGEKAGVLGEVLNRLANNLDKQREFKAKVFGALLYPALVVGAMIVVGIIMVFFVLPQMSEIYEEFDADLPVYTKIILDSSKFIQQFWYIALIGLVAGVVFLLYWLKTPDGKRKFNTFILKVPYLGELQNKIISTDVIRTMALLVKSGVSIVETLRIASEAATNSVYKEGIAAAANSVEKGMSLSISMSQEKFLPPVVIQMMSVGEETGELDKMLAKISKQFEKESLAALKALTSAIEPAMIIVLGVGVGIMAVSIILPIYNLTSQF